MSRRPSIAPRLALAATLLTTPSAADETRAIAETHAPITALAFAPGGDALIAGTRSGAYRIDLGEGGRTARLIGDVAVHDARFDPEGERLALAGGEPSRSGRVIVVDAPTGAVRRDIALGEDVVWSVDWSADGDRLAAATHEGAVVILDAATGEVLRTLRGHSRPVLAVRWLDAATVVSGGIDRSLRVWNVATGETRRVLENHTGPVVSLAVRPGTAPGPRWLASASEDGTVRIWQPEIGRLVRFARLPSPPLDIAWSPGDDRVFASCRDGHLRALDAGTAAVVGDRPALDGWAYACAVRGDDVVVAVGGERGRWMRITAAEVEGSAVATETAETKTRRTESNR